MMANKTEGRLLCPYRVEIFLSDMEKATKAMAKAMTNGGTYEPTDEETGRYIESYLCCDEDSCAAWNSSYCVRIFKGGKD